jgi:RHS repeat-associated protein
LRIGGWLHRLDPFFRVGLSVSSQPRAWAIFPTLRRDSSRSRLMNRLMADSGTCACLATSLFCRPLASIRFRSSSSTSIASPLPRHLPRVKHRRPGFSEIPRLESFRRNGGVSQCDIGHQGLLHDKEFDLVYNRYRMLSPDLGRFLQRDPIGYADGMSLYQYVLSRPTGFRDSFGMYSGSTEMNDENAFVFEILGWLGKNWMHAAEYETGFGGINSRNQGLYRDVFNLAVRGVQIWTSPANAGAFLRTAWQWGSKVLKLHPWLKPFVEAGDILKIFVEGDPEGLKEWAKEKVTGLGWSYFKQFFPDDDVKSLEDVTAMFMKLWKLNLHSQYRAVNILYRGRMVPPHNKLPEWPAKDDYCVSEVNMIYARWEPDNDFSVKVVGEYYDRQMRKGPGCCCIWSVSLNTRTPAIDRTDYSAMVPKITIVCPKDHKNPKD